MRAETRGGSLELSTSTEGGLVERNSGGVMVNGRTLAIAIAAAFASLVVAASATAGTTVPFRAIFVESGCGPLTICGTGNVAGLGHVENTVLVLNGCGPGCSLRTITFENGSTLVTHGATTGIELPGNSADAESTANPVWIHGAWTIVGGTGDFEGATGSGTGAIHVAAGYSTTRLRGTITLP
jgi:hypothetical protein